MCVMVSQCVMCVAVHDVVGDVMCDGLCDVDDWYIHTSLPVETCTCAYVCQWL